MTRQQMVEAAQWIIRLSEEMHGPTKAYSFALNLANAVLAREDDGPITPEWLESMWAEPYYDAWHFNYKFYVNKHRGEWLISTDTSCFFVRATRRHVRLAMELFGVEAKGEVVWFHDATARAD